MIRKLRKKEKEELGTKIFSGFLIFSMLIIAGFLIFSNYRIGQKRKSLLLEIEELKQEIGFLEGKNQELEQGISESEGEDYWEARVRAQGYKKPDETMVVVKKEAEAEKEGISPESNLWNKLLGQVKGIFE